MSRDGLLPPVFARIHPKFKTPSFSTIITGFIVGIGTLVFNLSTVTDLTSIGTLFAFVLVSAGVLRLHRMPNAPERKFKTPYINAQWIMPLVFVSAVILSFYFNPIASKNFIKNQTVILQKDKLIDIIGKNKTLQQGVFSHLNTQSFNDLKTKIYLMNETELYNVFLPLAEKHNELYEQSIKTFFANFPLWLFWLIFLYFTIESFIKKHSLIPVAGLITCLYMMSQIELKNWIGFLIWLGIGLIIYFTYSTRHSKLNIDKE
jgi:amino acid transporter